MVTNAAREAARILRRRLEHGPIYETGVDPIVSRAAYAVLSAVADALEQGAEVAIAAERRACADLARKIGEEMHDVASDPQEDNSDTTGEKIAEAILARP